MKFAKHLEKESIPEWRKAYLNYKSLKKRLKLVDEHRKLSEQQAALELDHAFYRRHTDSFDAGMPQRWPSNAISYWHTNTDWPFPTHNIDDKLSNKLDPPLFDTSKGLNVRPTSGSSPVGYGTTSNLDDVLFHASHSERLFFDLLNKELEKVALFYDEKENEAKAKLEALKMQLHLIADYGRHFLTPAHDTGTDSIFDWLKHQPLSADVTFNVARSRLKKALTEFYRSLEFLRSYKSLNETGFQKILKKFDKTAGWKASTLYNPKIKKYHWATSTELDTILHETETLYIQEFTDGHRGRGMRKLRVPENQGDYSGATWRIGFMLGMAGLLLFQTCQLAIDPKTFKQLPHLATNLQIYACFILPIFFALGFAVNLIVWHRSHINYKFIFELDPRYNLHYRQFAELPSILLLLCASIMHADVSQTFSTYIPSELWPLILIVALGAVLFCPFNIFHLAARKWLGVTLCRIALSYCFPVEFRDFFIADELNSLSYTFWTCSYFFCAYTYYWQDLDTTCPIPYRYSTPILASLPAWWRFLQCLRRFRDSDEKIHLANAAKYTSSIVSIWMATLQRIYPLPSVATLCLCTSLLNSTYTSAWDLKMDWGLLQPHAASFLLRDELVFHRWVYYVAIPINVFLRFSWMWSLFLPKWIPSQCLGFAIALLEVLRRLQWNIFRLENEHLNNCGQYRAIKEIPLPFALTDVKLLDHDEESIGSIPHPVSEGYRTEGLPITRQSSFARESVYGSFYGRRDFENKQDDHLLSSRDPSIFRERLYSSRPASIIDNVVERIRSFGHSSIASYHDDDDDDDDYDDEASAKNFISLK